MTKYSRTSSGKYSVGGKVAWTDGNIVKAEFVERTESKPTGMSMQSTSSKLTEANDLPF